MNRGVAVLPTRRRTSAPGVEPSTGQVFQRMRPDAGGDQHDAVGPYRRGRQGPAVLRGPHQVSHPRLDIPVEAFLRPPAEQPEPQADDRILDRRGP